MMTTRMSAVKRATLVTMIAALAMSLAGCYNVSGSVRLSGTTPQESTARVTFQASILEERLNRGVPVEVTATGELDDSRRLAWLRSYFDQFMDCCGNPPPNHINYVTVGAEPGTRAPANGRMMVWTNIPIADGPTFRTESFGGLNLSLFGDYVLVKASMTLPVDRTGEATGGHFEVSYPDNWRLVNSNGQPGVNTYSGEDTVFWSGKPGERLDIAAVFEVYKEASDVPRLQISPLVDANGNEIVEEPTPLPETLANLSAFADIAASENAPVEGEWVINSDGELELVTIEVEATTDNQGDFVVGIAWGALASGVLSGLIVLFAMAMRGRKLMAEANNAG